MPENLVINSQSSQKINLKNILIIVVVFILLIGGGVTVWLLLGNPSTTLPSRTPTSTPSADTSTPSAQKDKTANWKTYKTSRQNASNFIVNYPNDWVIQVGPEITFHPKGQTYPNIRISGGTGYSAEALYNSWKDGIDLELKEEVTTLANTEAKVLSGVIKNETDPTVKKVQVTYLLMELDDKEEVYYFILAYKGEVRNNNMKEMFNKVISTFEFVD